MKEINLTNIIVSKRREKGMTQEQLADHIGVSKASVSKWENGNSYPDITLLPVLASFFDITIDQLMNYSPQLSQEEIKKIYTKLAEKFATEPFEDVITECEKLVKKYYSCYPFLLEMALLYTNHGAVAKEKDRQIQVVNKGIQLFEHIRSNCQDSQLLETALTVQAMCHLAIEEPEKVLELLGDTLQMPVNHNWFISKAYEMLGNEEKAQEIIQGDLYVSIMMTFTQLLAYMQSNMNHFEVARIAFERGESFIEQFNLKVLNPNSVAGFYAVGAKVYQVAGQKEKALETLEKYVDICVHWMFPVVMKSDEFFHKIDNWLEENTEHQPLPRNEAVIKESMVNDVLLASTFDSLHDDPTFIKLVQKLKNNLEVK